MNHPSVPSPRREARKLSLRTGLLHSLLSALLLALVFLDYLLRSASLSFMDVGGWIFYLLSCLSHAALFAALPYVLLWVPTALLGCSQRVSATLGCIGQTLVLTLFVINRFVFGLYHFHINGLVLQLLTGPGASQIFVFSGWLYLKAALIALGIVAASVFTLWLAKRLARRPRKHLVAGVLLALLTVTLAAQAMHIYAAATMKRSVLESVDYLPYYFPLRMNTTLDRLGIIDGVALDYVRFEGGGGSSVQYPLKPLQVERPDTAMNIVILGVDSWNYRTMTEECVPNIHHFADSAQWYANHFSSSNGTRGGVFGLFTGVSPYYWDAFEYANIQPLLVSQLRQQGYHIQVYPSATFAAPPFAKVLFEGVEGLNIETEGETVYDRDCQLTRNFIADLDRREAGRPFFSFLFYDSPHAISCPKDKLWHFQPSWEYPDYMELSNDMDPTPYFNLYRNSVYQVDSLIGLALHALDERGLLKNTAIVITGDHGQEFNENHKGYWGHWANYSRPQTGVPMVYYYPGCQPKKAHYRTTHYDIAPTLMRRVLGVKNPTEDYSMGHLLEDSVERPWHVMGNDLFYAFLIEDDIIVEKRGAGNIAVFDKHMNPLDNYPLNAKALNDAILRLNRFYK